MSDDVIITTNETPSPPKPDATVAQAAAEKMARETIKSLDAGLVTRRTAVDVKRAAKRAIGGHDLNRSLDRFVVSSHWP
jgi:hypothetical protein